MAGILYSDYYLPEHAVSAKEMLRNDTIQDEKSIKTFIERSRLDRIAIEKERNEVEIYTHLIDRMINNGYGHRMSDISHIFYINPFKDQEIKVFLPYLLQKMYSLEKATIVSTDMKCGASLQALEIADAMIKAGRADNVLILSSVLGCKNRCVEQTIIGDGVGLLLYGQGEALSTILDFHSVSDGLYSYNVHSNTKYEFNKLEIYRHGCQVIRYLLEKHSLRFDQIRAILPLSLNYYNYAFIYAALLKIPESIFFLENISRGGHLGDVDTIRNFTDYYRQGSYGEGEYVLLYSLGFYTYDISYYSALCKLHHMPNRPKIAEIASRKE